MTDKLEEPVNVAKITHNPLYRPLVYAYWVFVVVVTGKWLGAFFSLWGEPSNWINVLAYAPLFVFIFYAILEDLIAEAVYEGTSRALTEMLEHMDDQFPSEEEQNNIAELYNSEPAGQA